MVDPVQSRSEFGGVEPKGTIWPMLLMVLGMFYLAYVGVNIFRFFQGHESGYAKIDDLEYKIRTLFITISAVIVGIRYLVAVINSLRVSENQFALWSTSPVVALLKMGLILFLLIRYSLVPLQGGMGVILIGLLALVFVFIANPKFTFFDGAKRVVWTTTTFGRKKISYEELLIYPVKIITRPANTVAYSVGLNQEGKRRDLVSVRTSDLEPVIGLIEHIYMRIGLPLNELSRQVKDFKETPKV